MTDHTLERQVRERAYALWQQDGCVAGRDLDYWCRAERELLGILPGPQASATPDIAPAAVPPQAPVRKAARRRKAA